MLCNAGRRSHWRDLPDTSLELATSNVLPNITGKCGSLHAHLAELAAYLFFELYSAVRALPIILVYPLASCALIDTLRALLCGG